MTFQTYTSVFWCSCVWDTPTEQFFAPLIHPVMLYFLQRTKLNCRYINLKGFVSPLFVVFYYSVTSHFCVCSQHPQCFQTSLQICFFLPPVPKGKPWDTVILYACLLLNEPQVEDKRNNFIPYPHMCKNAARKNKNISPFHFARQDSTNKASPALPGFWLFE